MLHGTIRKRQGLFGDVTAECFSYLWDMQGFFGAQRDGLTETMFPMVSNGKPEAILKPNLPKPVIMAKPSTQETAGKCLIGLDQAGSDLVDKCEAHSSRGGQGFWVVLHHALQAGAGLEGCLAGIFVLRIDKLSNDALSLL